MTTRTFRIAGAALALGLTVSGLSACGSDDDPGSDASATGGGSGSEAKKIALLLPENKTARYEAFDKPMFEAAVKADCPDCEVLYSNANQDAAKQQQQAEAAITQGAEVIVMSAVDGKSAVTIVQNAKSQGVPVVAYDRFIAGADYYVSYDNKKVGELQGTGLVEAMKADGKTSGDIVMINGAPTDANAADFKAGAHSVLDSSGYTVAAEFDTPDWSPDNAQEWMESQIGSLQSNLVGVYAANDGTAGGAIAAMKGGGVNPLPPVTGQDAELAGLQRIVAGDQALTIFKAYEPQATDAAKNAIALANDQKPASNAEKDGVAATILDPLVVTAENIKDTIVAEGYFTVADICTPEYADACAKAGLS